MINDPWLKSSIMARRRPGQRSGRQTPRALDRGARRLPLCLRSLCQARAHHQSRRHRRGGDRRCLRRRHHQRAGQSDGETEVSFSQSAVRPDCGQRRGEGRLPGRPPTCGGNKGRAARGHHLHHPGIRWPGRNRVYRHAQSALTGAGEEDARRQERRALERQDRPALRAVHRHHRGFAEIEAISSLQPDYHGGNMDLPDVAPGAILYFPVHIKGGLLYVGDCHAA